MRRALKRLLKQYGYPTYVQKDAVDMVIKRAELMAQMTFDLNY